MPIFLSLFESERKYFFKKLKLKIKCSWEKFYPKYNISRSSFFHYLSGRYGIPKNLFLDWKKLIGNISVSFIEKEKSRYIQKEIAKVRIDERLAEILGVLNGDGHLSNFKYEVCIVGDLREADYFSYLKKLFEGKFGLRFTLRKEKHCFKLRCYSKAISNLLLNKYLLPKGKKKGRLNIPKQVLKYPKWSRAYIRGIYDTDGSFYIRRKNNPVVQITSASPFFLKEIKEVLESLGFFISKGNQRIFIYRKDNIVRFFNEIKPSNSKHLKKYQNYLNLDKRG